LPYGEGITYWPLAEAVKEVVGLDDGSPPEEALALLTRALGEGPAAELAAHRVADTIGLVEVAGGVEEPFAAVRELFGSLARTRPWSSFSTTSLRRSHVPRPRQYLADGLRDAPS
jgi:hypothetical protein